MSKRLLYALIIIALSAIILIFNARGKVDVELVFGPVRMVKAIAFFVFMGVGVLVGTLLK